MLVQRGMEAYTVEIQTGEGNKVKGKINGW